MDYVHVSFVALVVAGLTFFSGFGLGTLLMPVFAIFFPIEVAVAATAIVHLANNLFKAYLVGRQAKISIVISFALPAAFAAAFGAYLLSYFSRLTPLFTYNLGDKILFVTPIKLLIACLIFIFAILDLIPFLKKFSFSKKLIPFGGILSGFFGGLSGHQGALRTAFLVRLGLDKKELIGTMVLSAIIVDMSRLLIYGLTFFQKDFLLLKEQGGLGLIIAGSLAAFLGSMVGKRILDKMTLDILHTIIGVLLILLAIALGLGLI